MIRLGMLDFDTSHVVEFAWRLNQQGIEPEQWVEGARIVVACPGESKIMPERIPGHRAQIARLGIPLVDRPEEMLGKADGMLIESQQGGVHWERARPFLEAGLPCFVDKPFACTVADARKLIDLAEKKQVPLFSASALRYAPDLVRFVNDAAHGRLHGVLCYGPGLRVAGNPGLFHYGIHVVEILYTLLGPGARRVGCWQTDEVDVATAQWHDGRLGHVRTSRPGAAGYGFLAFTETGVVPMALDTRFIYRELLKHIVALFATRRLPLALAETLEIIAFIEAAETSARRQGIIQTIQL